MEKDDALMTEITPFDLLNGAALAYVGDAVYEQFVRKHVIKSGQTAPNKLHRAAIKYVSAEGQAKIMKSWLGTEHLLSEKEIEIYKRGRNNKANTKAKNASIGDYRQATGFEALIGWLSLTHQDERCTELMTLAINYIENEENK